MAKSVLRYLKRNRSTRCCRVFSIPVAVSSRSGRCRSRLTVGVHHSALPFDAGWYGGVLVWHTPFLCRKSVKVFQVNWGPLSVTTSSGIPYDAKTVRSLSMVLSAVVKLITNTRTQRVCDECVSTSTRTNFFSVKANSSWIRCHLRVDHSHVCSGTLGEAF